MTITTKQATPKDIKYRRMLRNNVGPSQQYFKLFIEYDWRQQKMLGGLVQSILNVWPFKAIDLHTPISNNPSFGLGSSKLIVIKQIKMDWRWWPVNHILMASWHETFFVNFCDLSVTVNGTFDYIFAIFIMQYAKKKKINAGQVLKKVILWFYDISFVSLPYRFWFLFCFIDWCTVLKFIQSIGWKKLPKNWIKSAIMNFCQNKKKSLTLIFAFLNEILFKKSKKGSRDQRTRVCLNCKKKKNSKVLHFWL